MARLRRWGAPVVLALTLGVVAAAQPRTQAEVALQAAIRTETVDGNLPEAIKQYGNVAATYGANRRVAASALVHMADCYQKLGDAESKRIYQRLLRDFSDQPEAVAMARARLGADAPAPVSSASRDRALWSGGTVDLFGTVSPDGRYLSYTDWFATNNTMLHDFVTGRDRALTPNAARFGEFGFSGWSAISRDGRQIAFEWKPAGSKRDELHVSSLSGSGVPDSRLLKQFDDGEGPRPFDWSPDGSGSRCSSRVPTAPRPSACCRPTLGPCAA